MPATKTAAGSSVRAARRDRGWCHSRLVTEITRHPDLGPSYKIGLSTLRAVESGRTKTPGDRVAYAIATVLGFRVSYLWPDA